MTFIFAQVDPAKAPPPSPRTQLREISENFADPSTIPPEVLYWMFGVLVGFLLLRWAIAAYRRLRQRTGPVVLYHAIGRELGIDASDRWMLYGIARRAGLGNPLTLLMSATTLDHYAEREIESVPARKGRVIRRRIEAVRTRLFEDAPVARDPVEVA